VNPNSFDQVFQSLIGAFGQGVKPVTLPPLTGPGKTEPYTGPNGNGTPKTFPGQAGAGIFSVPQPNSTDSQGNPEYKIPSWNGAGWSLDEIKKWWDEFGQVTTRGIGWNILITLLLLIAFFVMLTGETNVISGYHKLNGTGIE
jgi:hypothetical protein